MKTPRRTRRIFALCIAVLILLSMPWFLTVRGRELLRVVKYEFLLQQPLIAGVPQKPVDCNALQGPKTLIAIAFGQSNSAYYDKSRHQPGAEVYNFHAGRCYHAVDPMPGADGGGGSVWTRLGDRVTQSGLAERVVFATIGVGSSEIARWTVGGDLHARLLETAAQMQTQGLSPTHLFWHQGEADQFKRTSGENYRTAFITMIEDLRVMGIKAPVYVSVSTYCKGQESAELQQAQRDLLDSGRKIYPGPDTDKLKAHEDRFDDCHFSETGLEKFADAWLRSLISHPD